MILIEITYFPKIVSVLIFFNKILKTKVLIERYF
ncbi:MAG: hypothetical protein ACJA1N_002403 [Saprospiraceae bacterium]|jgi:hypothetical protein